MTDEKPDAEPTQNVREALIDARDNGLIYWEPNTTRGHTQKALMLARIDAALSQFDAEPRPLAKCTARDAYPSPLDCIYPGCQCERTEAGKRAEAQSDAEPVKYEYRRHKGMGNWIECGKANYNANPEYEYRALYTAPPRPDASAEPRVTLDEIEAAMDRVLERRGFQTTRPDASAGLIEVSCLLDKRADEYVDVNEKIEQGYRMAARYLRARAADRSGK